MPTVSKQTHRKPTHLLFLLFTGVVLLVLGSGSAYYVSITHADALREQHAMAAIYSRSFEDHLTLSLKIIDMAIESAIVREADKQTFADVLTRTRAHAPFVQSLSILDIHGKIINSSNPANLGVHVEIADYMMQVEDDEPLRIGQPWSGRDFADGQASRPGAPIPKTSASFIPISQALRTRHGNILLLANIDAGYFLTFYNERLAQKKGAVELLRNDGIVLLSTDPDTLPGTLHRGTKLFNKPSTQALGNTERIADNGRAFLSAYQRSKEFPVLVLTHLDRDSILSWFNHDLSKTSIFGIPAIVLIILLAMLVYRTRKQAQHQLAQAQRNEQENVTALLNAVPANLLMIDQQGKIVVGNNVWLDFVRDSNVAFDNGGVGRYLADLLRHLNPAQVHQNNELIHGIASIANHQRDFFEFEYEMVLPNKNICFHTVVTPLSKHAQGGVLVMQLDISERKKIELDRARMNGLLQQSMHELKHQKFALDEHAIVAIADANATIIYANQKLSDISGFRIDQLLGHSYSHFKSSLHTEEFYAGIYHAISKGTVWHGELANHHANGETYWVASTIVPRMDANRVPYQYISISTDISRQKQAEQTLADAHVRELETGNEIQRSLLFGDTPKQISGAWIATYTEPSQGIDGDFFEISHYHENCFDLLVGDVMGKGVHAALVGAAVKNGYNQVIVELFAKSMQAPGPRRLPEPAAIINALHQSLTPRLIELDCFVTLALYRFDLADGMLHYVNAGHTTGLLARIGSGDILPVLGDNLPIGVVESEVYAQRSIPIATGDTLIVYSDGMTEARNTRGQQYGTKRMQDLIRQSRAANLPPGIIVQGMRSDLHDFVGSTALTDDQTTIIVELRPQRKQPRRTARHRHNSNIFEIRRNLAALPLLRAQISKVIDHLPNSEASTLMIATCEAVSNIIRHVPAPFADASLICRLTINSTLLIVELFYLGQPFEPMPIHTPDFSGNTDGGFGLYIIEHAVDTVQYLSPVLGVCCTRLTKRIHPLQETQETQETQTSAP